MRRFHGVLLVAFSIGTVSCGGVVDKSKLKAKSVSAAATTTALQSMSAFGSRSSAPPRTPPVLPPGCEDPETATEDCESPPPPDHPPGAPPADDVANVCSNAGTATAGSNLQLSLAATGVGFSLLQVTENQTRFNALYPLMTVRTGNPNVTRARVLCSPQMAYAQLLDQSDFAGAFALCRSSGEAQLVLNSIPSGTYAVLMIGTNSTPGAPPAIPASFLLDRHFANQILQSNGRILNSAYPNMFGHFPGLRILSPPPAPRTLQQFRWLIENQFSPPGSTPPDYFTAGVTLLFNRNPQMASSPPPSLPPVCADTDPELPGDQLPADCRCEEFPSPLIIDTVNVVDPQAPQASKAAIEFADPVNGSGSWMDLGMSSEDATGTPRRVRTLVSTPVNPREDRWLVLPAPPVPGGFPGVSGIREMFGDGTVGPDGQMSPNGFDALAKYDLNGPKKVPGPDGVIDENDPVFPKLRLWADLNRDGKVSTAMESALELIPLSQVQIVTIPVRGYVNVREIDNLGNETRQRHLVRSQRGLLLNIDVWLKPFNHVPL